MADKKKIIVAITGASGSIYASRLLKKLQQHADQIKEVGVVMSNNAKIVWKEELNNEDFNQIPYTIYNKTDFYAPFASGSAKFNHMIVCPCSMGTLSRIAHGISDDLITRAADVILKEKRNLLLVTRESPLSLIHINNMKLVAEAGGTIVPASPSYYSNPSNFEELTDTIIDRCLELIGINTDSFQWGE